MVTSSCIIDVLQASGIAPCPAAPAEAEAEETDSSHPPEASVGKSEEEDAKPEPGPSNVLKQEDEEDEVDELADDDDEDDEIVKREQALMVSVHLDHPPSLSFLFAPFFFLFSRRSSRKSGIKYGQGKKRVGRPGE
jgi:hypothetical protein